MRYIIDMREKMKPNTNTEKEDICAGGAAQVEEAEREEMSEIERIKAIGWDEITIHDLFQLDSRYNIFIDGDRHKVIIQEILDGGEE